MMVIEGTHTTGVGDASALVNDVNALRPRGIGVVGGIAHVVDPKGNRVLQALNEIVGNGDALLQSFRLRVAHIFLHVRFYLPLVGGVRFADVDGQEVGVILIVLVDFDDVADLATKRRSSVTAEDDHQRTSTTGALPQMEVFFTI